MTRDWDGEIARQIDRLEGSNGELVARFHEEMRAAGLTPATRADQVLVVATTARDLGKDLEAVEREDLVRWLANSDRARSTNANRLVVLRKFFRWLHGTEDYPGVVKGLKVTAGPERRLRPKDLLTEAEALALIRAARSPRDKALLALLWDSGCRVGEIISLRVGDVDTHPRYDGALRVALRESKTDVRELALFDCRPYLARWLAEHPNPEPEAPLFPSLGGRTPGKPLEEAGVRKLLRRVEERAKASGGLPKGKRIFAHLFRHSRTTDLIEKGYREPQLKVRQGWTQDSAMLARYVHLAKEAAQEEEARLHGAVKGETKETEMVEWVCPVCAEANLPESRFCARCGMALTQEAAERVDAVQESTTNLLLEEIQILKEKVAHLEQARL